MKFLDQVLYVPSHIDRDGRTAEEIAAQEPCAEQGFVTSTFGAIVWCRFFSSDGTLRTEANSESCMLSDLMPFAPRSKEIIAGLADYVGVVQEVTP